MSAPGSLDAFDRAGLDLAFEEAQKGLSEGGIPIGSALLLREDDGRFRVLGSGHNQRVQRGSAVLHAEMACLENSGRLTSRDLRRCTLFSTLSPCDMCTGAALLYRIPRVVVGEDTTFQGPTEYLRSRGVEVVVVNEPRCVQMMSAWIAQNPTLWNEDIGV
eukprot:RCo004034